MSCEHLPEAGLLELGYASYSWHFEATFGFLQLLALTYHVPDSVVLEVLGPCERPVSTNGSAMPVALFSIIFSCGLRLPFPHLVREILHHLGLAPAYLHPNAWHILIYCCILWHRVLLKSDLEHANVTYHEFLLTHNVKKGAGEI